MVIDYNVLHPFSFGLPSEYKSKSKMARVAEFKNTNIIAKKICFKPNLALSVAKLEVQVSRRASN